MFRNLEKWVLAGLGVVGFLSTNAAFSAIVQLTAEADRTELLVDETATITVEALVQTPASGDDGIFTFDLDLILGDSSVLSVVPGTMNRPDADDGSFGGSDGSAESWGLNAIAGGYWATDYGIGTSKVLFTVDVHADAAGNTSVTLGPDTDIMGVDVVLGETFDPTIDYSGASIAINVEPVIPGDCDRDGIVGDDDLSLLLANWGTGTEWGQGDLNDDDAVDDDDLSLLLANWDPPPAVTLVPEPSAVILLGLGTIFFTRRQTPM